MLHVRPSGLVDSLCVYGTGGVETDEQTTSRQLGIMGYFFSGQLLCCCCPQPEGSSRESPPVLWSSVVMLQTPQLSV
jgi:hypothetical protein